MGYHSGAIILSKGINMYNKPSIRIMPKAEIKLVYKDDLKAAVQRLDTCWNVTQIDDVIRSIEYFTSKMKNTTNG